MTDESCLTNMTPYHHPVVKVKKKEKEKKTKKKTAIHGWATLQIRMPSQDENPPRFFHPLVADRVEPRTSMILSLMTGVHSFWRGRLGSWLKTDSHGIDWRKGWRIYQ